MEFYLKFDGELKPNGKRTDKQAIREVIRPQMERLWNTIPLDSRHDLLKYPPAKSKDSIIKVIDGIKFAPLVTTAVFMTCELDITILWSDEPGSIINYGDIDNRLKTLFDALSCPNKNQMINKRALKRHDPYFTLLEDDKLITAVKVQTNKLLTKYKSKEVSVLIRVVTKPYKLTYCNMGL